MSIAKRRMKNGKDFRYQVIIDKENSGPGPRRRKVVGSFRSRKEAESAERQALEARERGIDISPKTVTVGELLERYLRDRETLGREAKTLQEYSSIAARLIVPHLGGIPLAKLRPAKVSEWIGELLKHGGTGKRPLSAKSVLHAFALLKGVLRFAVRMELAVRNVAEALPREALPKVLRSDAKALSTDEIARLLAAARGTRCEAFVALGLSLGCRRGELAGLSWSDIDTDKQTVMIRHSLSQTREGGCVLKATKSNRTHSLPLSRFALSALKTQSALQAKDKIAAGASYDNTEGAVFTNEDGHRITPMMASCAFERLARKAKLSTTRLHDLRHTAASGLIVDLGVDPRTVAGVLGHSNPSITLGVYSHLMSDAQRTAVDRLGERLERIASA